MKRLNIYLSFITIVSIGFLGAHPFDNPQPGNSNTKIREKRSEGDSGCAKNSCKDNPYPKRGNECKCDKLCPFYDDCCADAPFKDSTKKRNDLQCTTLPYSGVTVFASSSCPESLSGKSDIHDRCVSVKKFEDRMDTYLPVTDLQTELTYQNKFCAICNGKNMGFVSWAVDVKCPPISFVSEDIKTDSRIQKMVYNKALRKWVLNSTTNGSDQLITCSVTYMTPQDDEIQPRFCDKKNRSNC